LPEDDPRRHRARAGRRGGLPAFDIVEHIRQNLVGSPRRELRRYGPPAVPAQPRDPRCGAFADPATGSFSLGCNAEVMEFGFRRADVSARADAFCPGLFFSKVPQPTFTSRGYPPSSSSSAFAYFRSVYRAFSKPAVDRCEHIASFRPGLVAVQPGKAYCSAQLPELGPLLLGGFQGFAILLFAAFSMRPAQRDRPWCRLSSAANRRSARHRPIIPKPRQLSPRSRKLGQEDDKIGRSPFMIEDMRARGFGEKKRNDYIRNVRAFAAFSPPDGPDRQPVVAYVDYAMIAEGGRSPTRPANERDCR
jgi:hypothetical protein